MTKTNEFNKFFDKIFVINLFDRPERWEKVDKQFKRRGITADRFVAVDGRCKGQGDKACEQKRKTFEIAYQVDIPNPKGYPLKELVPASSLTIGTILILREQVRMGWKHVLICEDDIYMTRNVEKKLKQGIEELGNTKWDILYLGCGNLCGNKGVDWEYNSEKQKYLAPLAREELHSDYYAYHQNDLRLPCDDGCEEFSDHLSYTDHAGGTWCYGVSLAGAKKMLKALDNNAGNHIDHLLAENIKKGKMISLAFDPPIVVHESIIGGRNTDIPWAW